MQISRYCRIDCPVKTLSIFEVTRVGTSIVATIYLQLIQNRYMFRSFTVLQCSHQHCVEPFAARNPVVAKRKTGLRQCSRTFSQ